VPVNVLEPGSLYGERTNQVDLRFAKLLTVSGRRVQVGMDLYNAFNVNAIQTYNQTLGTSWLVPTAILPARFAKFSAQVDF
jgi:hypothetical protein